MQFLQNFLDARTLCSFVVSLFFFRKEPPVEVEYYFNSHTKEELLIRTRNCETVKIIRRPIGARFTDYSGMHTIENDNRKVFFGPLRVEEE
jgi:hypothetical protein